MNYDYTAIILSKIDVRETDRIYTLYTREAGIVKAVAAGVRKSQSKLAGNLENFNLAHICVVRNKGLGKITGSIVENNFQLIKENYEILNIVFETINIFQKIIKDEEKDEVVFFLLVSYLEEMENKNSVSDALFLSQGFIFKLLEVSGYKIEVDFCYSCGERVVNGGNFFVASVGGVLCGDCGSRYGNKMKLSENSVKIIRIFFQNKLSSLKKLKVRKENVQEIKSISENFIRWTF